MDAQKTTEQHSAKLADLADFSRYPIHDVDVIAEKLEELAARLRGRATGFANPKVNPVTLLGEILSEYTQSFGNKGTFLYNLTTDVEHLRADRAKAVSQ